MKYIFTLFLFLLIGSLVLAQTPLCNTDVSICNPGVAGPFNFATGAIGNGAGFDFANGSCATGSGGLGDNFGFILLNITTGGNLNLLVNANTSNGFIDVIVFDIPVGVDPCIAVMNSSNEIGCNYADFANGCVQFGSSFPCTSTVPAPVVSAGDQLMVIVHDWSNVNSNFTLQLGATPGSAGSGPPDATITAPSSVSELDPPFTPTTINAGGTWSASCGACINPNTGAFNPGVSGSGTFDIYYTIGAAPCDAYDTVQVIVTPDCVIPFTAKLSNPYEACKIGYFEFKLDSVPTSDYVLYFNQAGSAVEGLDYTAIVDSLIIPAGTDTGFIAVNALEDLIVDNTETLVLNFVNPCTNLVYQTLSLTILELGALVLNPAQDTICIDASSTLSASFPSLMPGVASFTWSGGNGTIASPNSASTLVSPLSSCSYNLSYSFGACNGIETVGIIVDTFTIDLVPTMLSCAASNDGSIQANVVGGFGTLIGTFNPGGFNGFSVGSLAPGTYTFTVTDDFACSLSDTVEITVADPLYFSLQADSTNCFGSASGQVFVDSISGGIAPYSYAWSANAGGATTASVSNLPAGLYTLTVSDANACSSNQSIEIFNGLQMFLSESHTDVNCYSGQDGAIDLMVSGGYAPFSYNWTGSNSFSQSVEDLNTLSAGTYNVSVEDANNCIQNLTVLIEEPATVVIQIEAQAVACFGGNDGQLLATIQSGGTAPFSFQWDAASGNQTTSLANGLSAGSYQLQVIDAAACLYAASGLVGQPNAPLSLELDSIALTCANADDGQILSLVSGGTPAYTYLWDDPAQQTSANAVDLVPGIYTLLVRDANACTISGSIEVLSPTPILLTLIADSVNCWGEDNGSITIEVDTATGTGVGYLYSIDGGLTFQGDSIFYNLSAGLYDQVLVQDIGSNEACYSDPFSIYVEQPSYFNFSMNPSDTTLQLEEGLNFALEIEAPYDSSDVVSISWFPSLGLSCNDCINPSLLTYQNYTEYTATLYYTGANDVLCNQHSASIVIVENNLDLFIPNAFTPSGSENVNDMFEIFGEGIEFSLMQIYNRWGEKVFESEQQNVSWDGTYQGELLNPGVYTYFVSVKYLDGKLVDRKGSVTLLR